MINFKIVIIWIDVTIFPWLTHCLKWACLNASRDFFENHAIYTILYKLNYKQQPGRWNYNPTLCEALQSNPCIRSLLFVIHLSHTCGVYNPCDKPYLYQTGDDLSNTSGQNFFYTALRFNTSVTYFRRFASTFNVTISTTKIDIKWILSKI